MMKNKFLPILGMTTLLTLTGAGCFKPTTTPPVPTTPSPVGDTTAITDEQKADDTYKQAVNLELPDNDNTAANDQMKSIVENVVGGVKITSFMQNFPSQHAVTIEYTAKHAVVAGDLNGFVKMVKDSGYTVDENAVAQGNGLLLAHNKDTTLILTFTIGQQKIGVVSGPTSEVNGANPSENSSS